MILAKLFGIIFCQAGGLVLRTERTLNWQTGLFRALTTQTNNQNKESRTRKPARLRSADCSTLQCSREDRTYHDTRRQWTAPHRSLSWPPRIRGAIGMGRAALRVILPIATNSSRHKPKSGFDDNPESGREVNDLAGSLKNRTRHPETSPARGQLKASRSRRWC